MKTVSAAFVAAQKKFSPALKSSTNPHFKSRYADLSACVEAVIDALNGQGIALVQLTHECADGVIVETQFLHESGESLSGGRLHVPAPKADPQGYGSALTYARRYSLMAACGIAPEDDDGNAATAPMRQPKTPEPTRTRADVAHDLCNQAGMNFADTMAKVLETCGVATLDAMKPEDWDSWTSMMHRKILKAAVK